MPGYAITPPQASPYPQTVNEFLNAIMQNTGGYNSGSSTGPGSVNVGGFMLPAFKRIDFDYYDVAYTNIHHQYFKDGSGNTVATLTYAYVQDPTTNANASIQAIVQS